MKRHYTGERMLPHDVVQAIHEDAVMLKRTLWRIIQVWAWGVVAFTLLDWLR